MPKQYIELSDNVNHLDWLSLHPDCLRIVAFVAKFAHERNLPFVITSMIRSIKDDKNLNAVSSTHSTGRAVDFSVKGWDKSHMFILSDLVAKEFSDVAAFSGETLAPTALIFHNNGNGYHGHIQVRG